MLRETERGYIATERHRYLNKPKPTDIRKHDSDIRKKAKNAIEYLAFLAEHLVPDQHEQVFNEYTLKDFFASLFEKYRKKVKTTDTNAIILDDRLFKIAVMASSYSLNCATSLLNADYQMLVSGTGRRLFPDQTILQLLTTLYYYPKIAKK